MSYTVNKTDGSALVTVNDGTINTSASSITLIGKNYAGYGESQNENFVRMLEHFANNTSPANALAGQLWYDNTNKTLNLYIGGGSWKSVGSLSSTNVAPSNPAPGELWFDVTNEQLYVWNGLSWLLIGPIGSAASGLNGQVVSTVTSGVTDFYIIKEIVNDKLIAVISPDYIASLNTPIPGYGLSTVRPGYNFVADGGLVDAGVGVYNAKFVELGEKSQFVLSTASPATIGSTGIINTTGDLSLRTVGTVTIGTSGYTGTAKLTVNGGTTTPQAAVGSSVAHFVNTDGQGTRITLDAYGAGIPIFTFRRANGTSAAPTSTLSGDDLGHLSWFGYGSSQYLGGRTLIVSNAAENWTNTANGTSLAFWTTPKLSITAAEVMRIDDVGNVGIGTTTPASKLHLASGVLTVPQGFAITPSITFTGDTDTGIYSPGGNLLTLVTQGVAALSINASGAVQIPQYPTNGFVKTISGNGTLNVSTTVALASEVSGTLPIANGGSGQTTANNALNAFLPTQATNGGKYLQTDGSNSTWATVAAAAPAITDDTATAAVMYPVWVNASTGTPALKVSSTKLQFNPSSGALTIVGQILQSGGGVAATPAYSFAGDPNTGIYSTGADLLMFATAGTERVRIGASGLVGIGQTANTYALEVNGDVSATIFRGQATSARYADLAERYEADHVYLEGTLMMIGGNKEVTVVVSALSEDVWGVISTKPGFLMNADAGDDDTHPAIAQVGRVPVRVVGEVRKGDRMVCAGLGVARAAAPGEATPFNVFGRAVESNHNVNEKLVLVAIK